MWSGWISASRCGLGRRSWKNSGFASLSLEVAILATIVSVIIAIPLGTIAAIRQDTWVDYVVRVISIGGLAIPSFWTGIMIILFLVIFFEWGPPLEFVSITEDPWENFKMLVWLIVSVGYRNAAVTTRMTRSTVLEVMREDYIRTAWSKGCTNVSSL